MIGSMALERFKSVPTGRYDVVKVSSNGDEAVLRSGVQYVDAVRVYCADYCASRWQSHWLMIRTNTPPTARPVSHPFGGLIGQQMALT